MHCHRSALLHGLWSIVTHCTNVTKTFFEKNSKLSLRFVSILFHFLFAVANAQCKLLQKNAFLVSKNDLSVPLECVCEFSNVHHWKNFCIYTRCRTRLTNIFTVKGLLDTRLFLRRKHIKMYHSHTHKHKWQWLMLHSNSTEYA